jgi:PEGA domain
MVGQRLFFLAPLTLLFFAGSAASLTGVAHAEEPAPADQAAAQPSAADRATARTLAQEGYVALRDKDYATAADRFSRAAALVHAPTLLRDLARAQVGLGKLVDAHENYSTIIREGVAADAPAPWQRALADAKAEIGAIPPRLPWVTITVAGPSEPVVTIDGVPIPTASLGVKRPADPGKHEIRASAAGFYTAKKTVTLREGESVNIAFELEEAPPDAAPKPEEEDTNTVVTTEVPDPPWRKPAIIGAFALGGAGLALGAVTGTLALSKRNKLSRECVTGVCGKKQEADLNSYHTFGRLSTIGFIVGGAGAAAGVVLLLVKPQDVVSEAAPSGSTAAKSSAGVSWSPFVGIGSAGVEGTF